MKARQEHAVGSEEECRGRDTVALAEGAHIRGKTGFKDRLRFDSFAVRLHSERKHSAADPRVPLVGDVVARGVLV